MSKGKRSKQWRKGRDSDSDERAEHIRPVATGQSVEAPAGKFVDIPRGFVAVPGAVVDDKGVMRREDTGELAIWHHRCQYHGPCERYTKGPGNFVKEEEVVHIAGAPWCPDCVKKMQEDSERKKIIENFIGSSKN